MTEETAAPLRVLIADDHLLFRDGLRALLASAPDTELVGEATTGDEAVALAAQVEREVVLMDIQMPGLNGIEATRRLVQANHACNVLILTMFEDDASVFAAMQAGSRGYLLKGAKHGELLRAIRTVGSGEAIFGPAIATRLMDYFASLRSTPVADAFPQLSQRERAILQVMAQGESNVASRSAWC